MPIVEVPSGSLLRRIAARSARVNQCGRRGAVAIITAICASLLLMIVGFAADYGYASYINQRLARAIDAATVGSVSQTAATVAGGYTALSAMQSIGLNIFNANLADLSTNGVNVSLSIVSDGVGGVSATGTYAYKVATFFGGVIGFSNIPVSGTAKSSARPPVYLNYYILVDNSQSMGIGSTQDDMTALYQRVLANNNASSRDGGCVFGCHVKQWIGNRYQSFTNEELAHNSKFGTPITLRIDSAILAINSIVDAAAQIAGTTKNIKFGIYTIGEDTGTGKSFQPIKDPPSTDYSGIETATNLIDLVTTNGNKSTGNTDFHDEITDFLNGLSPPLTQGSGASATSPLNYIFLVTDGMNDVNGNCTGYNLCASPINASDCNALKTNATLGVIYTTYLMIYQNNTAPTLEDRFGAIVGSDKTGLAKTALQGCATSSDWFFEAQDGPSLVSSMQTLFQRTQPISARITQ